MGLGLHRARLAGFGYPCWLEGKTLLLKVTPSCWRPELEMRAWSNVVCVHAETMPGLAAAFDAYTLAFL